MSSLVNKMENWEYSSYKDYIGLRKKSLCNLELAAILLDFPANIKDFYNWSYEIINKDKLKNIF
jgi:hypothetical protein